MSLLELDSVVKHYAGAGETVRAVEEVSLSVREGEMIAVHGPSGSGKTTLLLLIATLLTPDRGSIRYRGRALSSLSEAATSEYLRRDVGFVYQSFQLMPRVSALENASLKLLLDGVGPRKARDRARPWLERLGLGERMNHTPEQLSGGERQRVAIARALVQHPTAILADEPIASLDPALGEQIVRLLCDLARERNLALLCSLHQIEVARRHFDRVVELVGGRVA